ncbi:MAG: hypothetical protein IPM23_00150 [Candidatus Melainabacteria bacterium]|nr:hypothetical protein [Candidatus Melainabacteria bacterium]
MAAPGKVLIYAEDPGACNYLKELPVRLREEEIPTTLICAGAAVDYLAKRRVEFIRIGSFDSADKLLDEHAPTLLIVGTSEQRESLAHEMTDICRQLNIPTIGAVDMKANAEHRFRGLTDNPLNHVPDWLLVPDQSCAEAFQRLGYKSERIVVAGHPHFDFVRRTAESLTHRREELRRSLLPENRQDSRIITFVCEGYDLLNPSASLRQNDYSIHGRGKSDFRTAIVLEELIDAFECTSQKPFLIARLHPKMSGSELVDYTNEVDYFSRTEDPLEVLAASDLIVGMSSILLQEAVIMKRPTIAILPRQEEKTWLSVTAKGYIRTLTQREEIREFMSDLDGSLLEIARQECHEFNSDSLNTICAFIKNLVNSSE